MKKLLALALALCMLCSVAMAETTGEAGDTYTFNTFSTTFATNWNPYTYKTATASDDILTYITSSLYVFDYNENYDGYQLSPQMAVGEPEDVTADYVGEQWDIEEGEQGRAWKFTLRDDLCWQDGTPITAYTYEESVQLQLDPRAQNYRADSLYSGGVVVHNAEAYVKQGTNADTMFGTMADILGCEDMASFVEAYGEEKGYINWSYSFGDTYDFDTQSWTGTAEDEVVETPLTVKELWDFYTTGAGAAYATWATTENLVEWAEEELYVKYTYPEMSFDNVGIKALSDTELVVIYDASIEGFYLKYYTDFTLVNAELYKACESYDEATGVYTNSYGTSAETTMSYGPYVLETYQLDKVIVHARNENWFGYNMPEYEGMYQTTHINITKVDDTNTAMQMFLAGQIDSIGLNADYINEYINSEYCYKSKGASTYAVVVNPDLEALTANQATAGENINKTILTVKEFRMALSLGLDRSAFLLATSPSNSPAFALYNELIIADPETATSYRSTDIAKQVIVDFWGLTDEVGEGKMYATLDDAIDSITGYSPELAKEYLNAAYDKAIAEGLMDEDDVVEIIIGIPSTSSTYVNGYNFLENNYTELAKGTKLEGKLTFKKDDTIGDSFGDALRNNQVDMLFFVGWTGSAFDPYNLFQVYVSEAYQYDPSWDSTTAQVEVELDGVTYTASAYEWYQVINNIEATVVAADGTEVAMTLPYSTDADEAAKRMTVLGVLEGVILQNYDFIPLADQSSASLKGMKYEYFMEDEVYPLGRGGLSRYTYNYTDAEWEAFVAEQGGILNYN